MTFRLFSRNITAERDGYYAEARVIYRSPLGQRRFALDNTPPLADHSMKLEFSPIVLILAVSCCVSVLGAPPPTAADTSRNGPKMTGKAGCGFLITAVLDDRVARYSAEGERVWEYEIRRPIDAWLMENGNVLVTYLPDDGSDGFGGVRQVTPEKKVVFEYRAKGEVMSCQPLADGRMMVVEVTGGRIVEVDLSGKVVNTFDLKTKGMGHKTCRLARATRRGTYLVAETYVNLVREYDRRGHVIREIEAPGCFAAEELPGGNVLITQYYDPRIFEVDKDDRVVWELTPKDLPEDFQIQHFSEAKRLPNGNTLVVNCARDPKPGRVTVFEITPEKEIVWRFCDSLGTREITSIKPILEAIEK